MLKLLCASLYLANAVYADSENLMHEIDTNVVKTEHYVIWPNAVIPFYIDPEHFDHEQALSIMTALSLFAFKTCLKFNPVLVRPTGSQHVLTFENPSGVRKCVFNTEGHSPEGPHRITLGYGCMRSPQIEMMLMRALGFPFEHNRASRDLYIDVQFENIDPGAVELFTKDSKLPPELRPLRYDVNSVTHFGDREFSKNGHRTIIFKDHNVQQNRNGLSELDLRKIEIVYGPECLKRERQEKIELCQNYPGVARRKREIDISVGGASLRVNRDITAPPAINTTEALSALAQLGVENEAHDIKERVHQLSSRALTNAQVKYCNGTAPHLRSDGDTGSDGADPLGTVELLADYAKSIVDHAGENTKSFCEAADSLYVYQRTRCIYEGYGGCRGYRSTKSGDVKHSTQHRPTYQYPTKHPNRESKYEPMSYRTGNNSDADKVRRKREAATVGDAIWSKEKEKTNGIDVKSKPTASPTDKTVSDARRRFKEIPFSVHKHKKSAKEKVYASDLSLEGEQGKLFKNNRPAANIRLAQRKKKMNGERTRNKREASAVTTSQPDGVGQAEDVNRKETSTDNLPTADKGPASDQITVSNRSETGGRRKFKDTQYRVYKGKNNEKKRTYASELSLESKQVKRFKKINRGTRTAKQRSGRRGMIRDPADRVRRKRETAPDESPVQANGDADEDVAKEKTDNDSPSADAAAGVDQTVEGRRRFGDIPFNVYNKKKNGKEEGYASDLSLEDKQDKASKKNRQMKSHLTQRKKKRGEDRSEETRPVSERDRTPRKAAPRTVELSKDNEEFYAERRWPDGIVRYMIKDIPKYDLDDVRYRLEEVNKILKEKTCTRLMEITDDERSLFEDYLVLDNSPDYVTGRVGGKQNFGVVELFEGGQHRQHAAMVVMSMLGFYFEPSRHDRDRYIRVHLRHIRPDKLHHFEKLRPDATLPLPYDYESATHPAWQFWRHLGKTGISSVATYKDQDPDGSVMKALGHHAKLLSDLDIVKINSVYGITCFRQSSGN